MCGMYSAGSMLGSAVKVFSTGTTVLYQARGHFEEVYTGLTPGSTYTFTPNFYSMNGNNGGVYFGVGVAGIISPNPAYGPAVTEVYSV